MIILIGLEGSIKHAPAWNVKCNVSVGQRGSGEGDNRAWAQFKVTEACLEWCEDLFHKVRQTETLNDNSDQNLM